MTETPKQRVWGRWVVLAAFLVGVYLFYVAKIPVIMPEVLLPAEEVFHLGGFPITNTLIALFFVDLIVFGIAFGVSRAVASGKQILGGISGAVEALIEMIYGMTEGTAGKWAKTIFPWFATIMLLVLVANWMEMIPGIETVGLIHSSEHGEFATQQIGPFLGIVKAEGEGGHALIPYVRVVSSDLNFTLAIAIVVVVMIQYYGIKSQGAAYFSKFWNVKTVFTKPIFGVIDFGVGLLEIVSEFSKVLSFAFLGPLVGSLARIAFGPLADKYGGAILTHITGIVLIICTLGMAGLGLLTPVSLDQFPAFVAVMLLLFFFTGIGNAATFRQYPIIFADSPRQSAGVIGWTAAIAAYGPFLYSTLIGSAITNTGSPLVFFYGTVAFYAAATAINWWYYTRKGCEKPS